MTKTSLPRTRTIELAISLGNLKDILHIPLEDFLRASGTLKPREELETFSFDTKHMKSNDTSIVPLSITFTKKLEIKKVVRDST